MSKGAASGVDPAYIAGAVGLYATAMLGLDAWFKLRQSGRENALAEQRIEELQRKLTTANEQSVEEVRDDCKAYTNTLYDATKARLYKERMNFDAYCMLRDPEFIDTDNTLLVDWRDFMNEVWQPFMKSGEEYDTSKLPKDVREIYESYILEWSRYWNIQNMWNYRSGYLLMMFQFKDLFRSDILEDAEKLFIKWYTEKNLFPQIDIRQTAKRDTKRAARRAATEGAGVGAVGEEAEAEA